MKDDLSGFSMLELFRVEAENQTTVLTQGLLEVERGRTTPQLLESLMRAAHSLKGAARIVNLPTAVRVAHVMEDCFVAAQQGQVRLQQGHIDVLLRGVDLLLQLSRCSETSLPAWELSHAQELEQFCASAETIRLVQPLPPRTPAAEVPSTMDAPRPEPADLAPSHAGAETPGEGDEEQPSQSDALLKPAGPGANLDLASPTSDSPERIVRLNAANLNRLLGLAGESLVESRWLRPFADSMQRLRRMQSELERTLDGLRGALEAVRLPEPTAARFGELLRQAAEIRQFLGERSQELELYDRRAAHLSNRLYLEVLRTRMRPFNDGTQRFPRMVRDLARSLGKQVRLEILGANTQVDRDILDRLETPLAHLLRNAVDHGCEPPELRAAAGKPPEALIQLEARHSAGLLLVTISDDGAGVDTKRLRQRVVEAQLTTAPVAERMSEAELLEFLFLPGFTLKDKVTEISGRGVGLDVVQNMVKGVRGSIRVLTQAGRGTRFQLQLPLTLSVLRTLLIEVANEPYAIPLAQITHTLKLEREQIETLEGRHFFRLSSAMSQGLGPVTPHLTLGPTHLTPGTSETIGLLTAHQLFESSPPRSLEHGLPVVVLGDRNARYGLVVDRFLGERELVVQPLDPRLGKVKDISAAALMEDGSPVLIVDVDDLVRSIEKMLSGGRGQVSGDLIAGASHLTPRKRKRVLAVDDSLTVRELERKLLTSRGYLADVAVDGMDGWNAVRTGVYDLVITDVDMPRMDGIELATLIKRDAHLKSLPVMIVSYKDREEDRMRGLEAGADYYLTKGSFHDETLLQAVLDLIGEPEQ